MAVVIPAQIGRNMPPIISMRAAAASRMRNSANAWWRIGRNSRADDRPANAKRPGRGARLFFRLLSGLRVEPGHQRGMDHVRHALAPNRADREINILQGEAMGGDL